MIVEETLVPDHGDPEDAIFLQDGLRDLCTGLAALQQHASAVRRKRLSTKLSAMTEITRHSAASSVLSALSRSTSLAGPAWLPVTQQSDTRSYQECDLPSIVRELAA